MVSTPSAAPRGSSVVRFLSVLIGAALLLGGGWYVGRTSAPAAKTDEHAGHDHAAHAHDDPDVLDLTEQARRNINLEVGELTPVDYERTVTIPGILREKPGQSTLQIVAPLTGVVARVLIQPGEAVEPGMPLFEMRLTHEELVQAQGELLKAAGEIDVTKREITRLEKVTADGSIAGKQLLERQYELQKQEVTLQSLRQTLALHGLSAEQVGDIIERRSLLQTLIVSAPAAETKTDEAAGPIYFVQELDVARGQHMEAGASLAVLADHAELLIEGNAFERDLSAIQQAVAEKRELTAVIETPLGKPLKVADLTIVYVDGKIDPAERTVHFFVALKNEIVRDDAAAGLRRIDWKYRPGQRMQLLLPVETWKEQLVVPADAVAQEGIETYVFQAAGDQLRRRPVHVRYRDPLTAVLANDGSVFPGDRIAFNAAQQLQIAVKNKSGGAVDPHAGHNH